MDWQKPSKELSYKMVAAFNARRFARHREYIFNPKIEMVYWPDLLYEKTAR
jgi:hypothetical protein